MPRHYNLYYILLEEKRLTIMPPEAVARIQKNIEEFWQKIKPPGGSVPPIDNSTCNQADSDI